MVWREQEASSGVMMFRFGIPGGAFHSQAELGKMGFNLSFWKIPKLLLPKGLP